MNSRTLDVIPNPYLSLDENGNPAHVVAVDPSVNKNRQFVGATMEADVIDSIETGELLSARQFNTWTFTKEPVKLMNTEYYLNCIRNGELIPANANTAKLAGLEFRDPKEILADEAKKAAYKHRAAYGELPSFHVEQPTVSLVKKRSADIPNDVA